MSAPDDGALGDRAGNDGPGSLRAGGAARLAVVKLGGSLGEDPLLVDWLRALADLGAGRVVIVPGGGTYADGVRTAQARWRFDDLAAHNMAVLAMAQFAYQLQALASTLRLATGAEAVHSALRAGRTVVWLPLDALRPVADDTTTWDTTSDTLALRLAAQLGADALLLVKSCAIDPAAGLADLGSAGIVDGRFVSESAGATCRIGVLDKHRLSALGGWLNGAPAAGCGALPNRTRR